MIKRDFWKSVFMFVGTSVGAGVLGLPYVFSKVGFLTGIFIMILIATILGFSYIIIGEVCQRSKGNHQLVGLVEKYIGKRWKIAMAFVTIFGLYGALVAYGVAAGDIFSVFFGGSPVIYSVLFVSILSTILFFKLKTVSKYESVMTILKIVFCLVVALYLVKNVELSNLISFNLKNVIYPLGVIMFALSGINILPTMNEELKNKKDFRKAVLIGLVISVLICLVFSFSILGVMGANTPEVATIGLSGYGNLFFIIVNIFAILSLATAFIGLGFALKEVYIFDYKMNEFKSWCLVFAVTLFFILFNVSSFIKILGITGAVSCGLSLILLFYCHTVSKYKFEKQPSYNVSNFLILKLILFLLFIFVVLNEIFGFFII